MGNARRKYGWKPQLPDHRDFAFASSERLFTLPTYIDLRPECPPIYSQGELGSCTANAIAAAFEFDLMREGKETFTPSRLFIYYNERAMEGAIDSDSGASIRDGIKSISRQGVCRETDWPYIIENFDLKPHEECYTTALSNKAVKYSSVSRALLYIKDAIAQKFPVIFGFTVLQSFESDTVARTGSLEAPSEDQAVLGGHAVLAVGYDDTRNVVIVRNSWGPSWGDEGYFYMPYEYFVGGLCSDCWVLKLVN